jgi:hypothetical protein
MLSSARLCITRRLIRHAIRKPFYYRTGLANIKRFACFRAQR